MEILAFRGDEFRGEEIKNILESLGGYNDAGLIFTEERYIYYFKECKFYRRNVIKFDTISDVNLDDFIIYTVDKFKEKFKFNVGDSVRLLHLGESGETYTITGMKWDYEYGEVMYKIDGNWYRYCLLNPVEKKYMTHEVPKSTRLIDNLEVVEVRGDEVEIVLDSCDSVSLKEGRIRIVRKSKYPKTYKECCEILQYPEELKVYPPFKADVPGYNVFELFNSLETLRKLLICRDTYWKIAGEGMGLGKPWKPDWNDLNRKYFISLTHDGIVLYDDFRNPQILAFPTEEMCDIFFENFKDLIEECKELL